jgi:hypothetical protein
LWPSGSCRTNRGVRDLDSAVVRGRLACPAIRLRPRRLSTRSGRGKPSAPASLIPNLDFVAIRVEDVGVGIARAEFASPEQLAAGLLDFVDGRVDVAG